MTAEAASQVVELASLSGESLSAIFVPIEVSDGRDVYGRYELLVCDDVLFIRATTGGGAFRVTRRPPRAQDAEGDAYFVCLQLHGGTTLRQHGRECLLRPGDLGMLDARSDYAIHVASGGDALWLRFPRSRLDWPSRTMRTLAARRMDGTSGLGLLASRYVRSLFEELPRVPSQSHAPLATAMVDLIGEAASATIHTIGPSKPTGRRTLERARVFIEHHLGEDDLSPARIAAGVGISTRYLSDLFANEGMTTMRHVAARRLELCRAALAREMWRPGVITELAFANGFMNLSSFNRLFKNTYGATPRQVMKGEVDAS